MSNNQRTYIIAEAGVNHNGDVNLAVKLVEAAAEAGADAVKFQTFCPEKLASPFAQKAAYQNVNTKKDESQLEMLKKLTLSHQDFLKLKAHCDRNSITFLSTPFDADSVDFLIQNMKLPIIKIPSGEITSAPLLLQIAQSKVSVILSTGMSTLGEIEQALGVLAFGYLNSNEKPSKDAFMHAYTSNEGQHQLKQKVTLLHCTSAYPAPFTSINLRAMDTLKSAFDLPVGYSDHSSGISVPIAAVARGAVLIEKHFTLDRALPGPDHQASLESDMLKKMVESIREVELSLGEPIKKATDQELETKAVARKSLVADQRIKSGDFFTKENVSIRRPGDGVSAIRYWDYIGRQA